MDITSVNPDLTPDSPSKNFYFLYNQQACMQNKNYGGSNEHLTLVTEFTQANVLIMQVFPVVVTT